MAAQVALKRQQAAEDAIALNMRAVTTGEEGPFLPQGPIVGLPHSQGGGQETNAERRIRGNHISYKILEVRGSGSYKILEVRDCGSYKI